MRPALAPVLTPSATPRSTARIAPPEPSFTVGLRGRLHDSRAALLALVLATFVVHLVANLLTPYGLHRDELLYLSMGRHLRLLSMDFPPGIAIIASLSHTLLGDSLVAIRLTSALAGTALVALTFVLARMLGGPRRAGVLAALAVLTGPLFLRSATLFQPVVFDQLAWTLGFVALVRIGSQLAPRARVGGPLMPHSLWSPRTLPQDAPAWIVLGVAVGLGLLTKFSIGFFGVAAAIAILATPLRRTLRTRWPWFAVALALGIGLPSIVGQVRLGWPVAGQMTDLRATQLERLGPLDFVFGQLRLGPAVALAVLGLWYLLRADATRPWRAVGWTCAAAFGLLLALHGKAYYAGPLYPTLLAAGAVALEARILRLPTYARRSAARVAAFALVLLYGLATLPFGLPVLPPAAMARYAAAFGAEGTTTNTGTRLALPQDYADMLGWPQQAAAVRAVVDALPSAQRAEVVLLAGNYGEAGALEFYGPTLGLPPVISAAGSFWFFGPGDLPGATVVAVGIPPDELRRFFRRVTPAAHIVHENQSWVVEEERDVVISICEDPIRNLQDVWPSLAGRN